MKVFFKMHFCINQKNTFYINYEHCCLWFTILLVAINSINFCIKICRRVAAYRQIHNFLHIILKKTKTKNEKSGRERDYLEKKGIHHSALPFSFNLVSLILVWFKFMFSKYVQLNLKSWIKSLPKHYPHFKRKIVYY